MKETNHNHKRTHTHTYEKDEKKGLAMRYYFIKYSCCAYINVTFGQLKFHQTSRCYLLAPLFLWLLLLSNCNHCSRFVTKKRAFYVHFCINKQEHFWFNFDTANVVTRCCLWHIPAQEKSFINSVRRVLKCGINPLARSLFSFKPFGKWSWSRPNNGCPIELREIINLSTLIPSFGCFLLIFIKKMKQI